MLPLFKGGGVVFVEAPPAGLSPGDCAVYAYEGRLLLHRVIAVNDAGPLLADDAGRIAGHQVPWRDVMGRVLSRNPLKNGAIGLLYSSLRKKFRFHCA